MNVRRVLSYPLLSGPGATRFFHVLAAVIVLTGIVLRVVLLLQNRDLIIDEANIVRNLAERDFAGLLAPLSYEQYAPPVWLWVQKAVSVIFGYGEIPMRAFSTVCGVGALLVMWRIGLKLLSPKSLWLPLGILALAPPFIRYSAEVKQYETDVLVTLLLLYVAIQWRNPRGAARHGALRWGATGAVAIWTSMPAVFMLAGIGVLLLVDAVRAADRTRVLSVAGIGALWLVAFGLYYATVLRTQIGSDYLQNYHRDYFLFALPANAAEWSHNKALLRDTLSGVTGWDARWRTIGGLLLLGGTGWALAKSRAVCWAVAAPAMLVLIAVALNQFSLIERVALFLYPLGAILLGVGFDRVLRIPFLPLQIVALLFGAAVLKTYQWFDLLHQRYEFHELTPVLDWVQRQGGTNAMLYIHDATVPTFRYYTTLHPAKTRFTGLRGAYLLTWDTDYKAIAARLPDTAFVVFTGGSASDRQTRLADLSTVSAPADSFQRAIGFGYRLHRRPVQHGGEPAQ